MRSLLAAGVALVAILGIVSGNLWLELRAAQQELADLHAQLSQSTTAGTQQQPLQTTVAAVASPQASSPPEQTAPVSRAAEPAPPAPAPAVQVALPVNRPALVITDTLCTTALLQSEQTATARVLAWKDRLAMGGQTLTTEQLQALNAAATAELRRETEESLELAATAQPTDVESSLRLREETIQRQNDTNMRILAAVASQLTAEQSKALRGQFESGHAARMATFRAEQEMVRQAQ